MQSNGRKIWKNIVKPKRRDLSYCHNCPMQDSDSLNSLSQEPLTPSAYKMNIYCFLLSPSGTAKRWKWMATHFCKPLQTNKQTNQPSNQVWAQAGQSGRTYSSNSIIRVNPPPPLVQPE
jgi:hypothetical protein